MMKALFLSMCLLVAGLVAPANAQFFTSETTRKAGEKLVKGDRPGAIAVLDKAIEKRKDLLEAYQMRANLRAATGDFDGAIADYSAALEINPNDAKIYQQRALFRRFKRDYAGAVQDLDSAIANGLKSEKVYTLRARLKLDMGDVEGAIADYYAALGINPDLVSAQNELASMLERKGDLEEAIARLQAFLDRYEGKHGGKLPSMNDANPTVPGISIKRQGKEKDSAQVFLQSYGGTFTANSPEEMEKHEAELEEIMNLMLAYANLGRMYAKKSEFDKALENYEKGLKIRRGDLFIHKLRSEIRIKKGDLQGAIEDLTVVANSPQPMPDSHLSKGLLLVLRGNDAEAEKEFALYVQTFPESAESLRNQIEEAKKLRSQQPPQ